LGNRHRRRHRTGRSGVLAIEVSPSRESPNIPGRSNIVRHGVHGLGLATLPLVTRMLGLGQVMMTVNSRVLLEKRCPELAYPVGRIRKLHRQPFHAQIERECELFGLANRLLAAELVRGMQGRLGSGRRLDNGRIGHG
jgi:hypothetical protein